MVLKKDKNERRLIINDERAALMKRYLNPEEITADDRAAALQELADQGSKIADLYHIVFKGMYEQSKPRFSIVRILHSKHNISELAAEALIDRVSRDVGQVFNVQQEVIKQFSLVDYHISRLSEYLESEADIDVQALTAELRMWVDLKNKMISGTMNTAIEGKKVQVEEKRVDAISNLSNEQLMELMDKL